MCVGEVWKPELDGVWICFGVVLCAEDQIIMCVVCVQVVNLSANDLTKAGVKRVQGILSVLKGCEVDLSDNGDDSDSDGSDGSGEEEEGVAAAAGGSGGGDVEAEPKVFDIRADRGALTAARATELAAPILRCGSYVHVIMLCCS